MKENKTLIIEEMKCQYQKDLIFRLRKRAEIRRQIPNRKSVLEGKPDRIADLLEEAANVIAGIVKDAS